MLSKAGKDTFRYFPVRLVPAITSLVTVPVFTRLIEREDYGHFALITSAVSLLSVLATQWVNGSIVRLYWTHEREGSHDEYVSTAIWSTVASLSALCAVTMLGVWLFRDSLPDGLLRLAPYGVLSLAVNYLVASVLQILRAGNRSKQFSRLSVLSTILGTAISLALVAWARMGAAGILLGIVVGNAMVLPFGLFSVKHQGRLSPRLFSREVMLDFMRYGFPFVPAAASSWILVMADRYVIQILRTSAEVGLYSVNYGLGEKIMQLVVAPFMTATAPVLIQTFEKKGEELTQRAQTELTRYFAMATFPLLFGMAAVARHFVEVFTGPEYHESYRVLPMIAAGAMLYGLVHVASNGITLYRKSSMIMTNTLAAAAFNVAANFVFVGRYGYIAAAWTTVASYLLLLGLTWWRGRHFMAWKPPWLDLAKVLAASLLMAGVLVGIFGRWDSTLWVLMVEVAVGIPVFAAALWALRGFRAEELALVREYAGKVVRRGR